MCVYLWCLCIYMYVLHIVVRYAALRMLLFAMKMPSVSVNVLETHAEWVFRVWSIFCEFVFNSSAVVWCASVYVCFCCLFLRLWMCYLWFCVLFLLSLSRSHIVHLTVDVILGNLATQLTQNEWLTNEKSFAPIQIRTICFANTQIIIINNFDVDFICDSISNDQLFKIFNSDSNESFYWW